MRNYKIIVSYDGTRYKGWQRLGSGETTIQDVLESVLSEMLQHKIEIHGSGRTDAGVHARGQVFSVKLPFSLSENFIEKANQRLPEDIRLLSAKRIQGGFHARYSAVGKKYHYYVDTKEKPGVFRRKYAYHFPYELDLNAMEEAKLYMLGRHDFSSFTDDKSLEKNKVRTIESIQIDTSNGVFTFQYCGDGFLQHMVRILTGTLLEVGQGKREPDDIKRIFEKKERAAAGFMVPAKGLFLEEVYYLENRLRLKEEK